MQRKTFIRAGLGMFASAALGPSLAAAGDYPNKPMRIVVGFAPGGATDAVARVLAQKLGELYQQTVIVENREGAGTNIAVELVSRAPADGYTLLMGGISNAINATLYPKLPFNFPEDFVPVSLLYGANVLVVNPNVPARTLKEFIELAKSKAGGVTFASSGTGSSIHMSAELFKMVAGVNMLHVPYKGSSPAVAALLGGQVDAMFDSPLSSLPHIKSGKLRALAVTTAKRNTALPDVPTAAEAGLPGFVVEPWQAVFVSSKTPGEITEKLNADIYRIFTSPEVRTKLISSGYDTVQHSQKEHADFLKGEAQRWGKVVKATGATPS